MKRSHNLTEDDVHMRFIIPGEQARRILSKIKKRVAFTEIETKFEVSMKFSPFVNDDIDRILSISGSCENVGRAVGALVRLWNEESDQPSDESSKVFTLQMLIPFSLFHKVVGSRGCNLKSIQKKSSATIRFAHKFMLDSTDRLFYLEGVADAIHRAIYFISLKFQEYSNLLAKIDTKGKPYIPTGEPKYKDDENPLKRRISFSISRETRPTELGTTHNEPIVLEEDLPVTPAQEDFAEDTIPCSPPPEKQYKLASKRYEEETSPAQPASPVYKEFDTEDYFCPPSPPLSVDDEAITKKLVVTCPMVGTVLSFTEELLNLIRQNSGAAIRVMEIMNDEQVLLTITGTKTQVTRVMDDLTLTTRNSYLVSKAIQQPEWDFEQLSEEATSVEAQ